MLVVGVDSNSHVLNSMEREKRGRGRHSDAREAGEVERNRSWQLIRKQSVMPLYCRASGLRYAE
jgi:hypothetical protein